MSKDFNPESFIGMNSSNVQIILTQNDAIIYALGIGFSQDPLKQADFKYTYELNDQFSIFPTFGTYLHRIDFIKMLLDLPGWPRFDPAMLLHAEQKLQMIAKSLKPNVSYLTKRYVKDIIDKGKMTLVCLGIDIYEKVNDKLQLAVKNETTLALLKFSANGYKGKGTMSKLTGLPKRNPDYKFEASSYPNQAIFYRLAGDTNPLHIDPKVSAVQKFPRPIIHGLATKGIISRILVEKLLDNDGNKVKSIHSRFAGHVFPGQSFEISVWKENTHYAFQAKCKERGTIILTGILEVRQSAKL